MTGHLDHVAASSAGLLAAETLNLPVLGWTLPESVVAQLNQEFDASFTGHQDEDIDLRVTVCRQRPVAPAVSRRMCPTRLGIGCGRRVADQPEESDNNGHCRDPTSEVRRHRGHRRTAGTLGLHIRRQPRHVWHRPQRSGAGCREAFAAAGHSIVLELGAARDVTLCIWPGRV